MCTMTKTRRGRQGLWTRDFTIITLGSAVSMLGNSMVSFAVSLFVLDLTGSPSLYALYLFLNTVPQILAPMMAGPLMDRFPRRKTIYCLDFLSAALYLSMGVLVGANYFHFAFLALMTFILGCINSVYQVAFTSFYPMLIPEGHYSKAYSVSSTLETLSYTMIVVSAFLYQQVGIAVIFLANSVLFLIAALCETRIRNVETESTTQGTYTMKSYLADSKAGMQYIRKEKGLLLISIYFAFVSFAGGATSVITLPWFRKNFPTGEYIYMLVWVFMVVGKVAASLCLYRWQIPQSRRYAAALSAHILSPVLESCYLFLPLPVMKMFCFVIGISSAAAYTIRTSAVQAYVPNEQKGRFNGAFFTITTIGSLLGQLSAGALIAFIPMRVALNMFMAISALSAVVIIGGGRKYVRAIYASPAL